MLTLDDIRGVGVYKGWRHFVDSDISWTLFFKIGDISWTILVKLLSARLG